MKQKKLWDIQFRGRLNDLVFLLKYPGGFFTKISRLLRVKSKKLMFDIESLYFGRMPMFVTLRSVWISQSTDFLVFATHSRVLPKSENDEG